VTLADGSVLGYDELVIATGLVPRRIPSFPELDGIRVLRHWTTRWRCATGVLGAQRGDRRRRLHRLRGRRQPAQARCRRRAGRAAAQPLASVLGEQIGALVTRLHRAEGVDVRTGVGVAEVRGRTAGSHRCS
jgi:NADPH-dependent 2,4-dienoyl-CoA reductase/sulfur reductase-like enzyme